MRAENCGFGVAKRRCKSRRNSRASDSCACELYYFVMKDTTERLTAREAARKFTPQVAPNLQQTEKVSSQAPGAFVERAMKARARLRGLA
jgi:hypothetical protein